MSPPPCVSEVLALGQRARRAWDHLGAFLAELCGSDPTVQPGSVLGNLRVGRWSLQLGCALPGGSAPLSPEWCEGRLCLR